MPVGQRMLMAAAGANAFQLPTSFELVSAAALFIGGGAHDWLGRPQLLDVGDGVWMLIYRAATNHSGDTSATFHIRFSDDEGATWTDADDDLDGDPVTGWPLSVNNSNATLTDAILIKCANGDILCLAHEEDYGTFTRYGTQQYRSSDGGQTWSNEGGVMGNTVIAGGGQAIVVAGVIYCAVFVDPGANQTQPYYSALYKSEDDGETWSHVSDMSSTSDDTNECSLVYLGGTKLGSIIRTEDTRTLQTTSNDMGATWGALTDISSDVDVLHRPMLWTFPDEPGRVYVTARKYVTNQEHVNMRYSDDDLITWSDAFDPEPADAADCGYTSMLKRSDDTYYLVTYRGTNAAADIVRYIIEGVA